MEENYNIVLNDHGKFTTSFDVPDCLVGHIIGRGGNTLRTIKRKTKTFINILTLNENSRITITGDTEVSVEWARSDICQIVSETRTKIKVTHFISIPLVSQSTTDNLEWFKAEILKDPPAGVTASTFQVPHKLHLTLSVFTLLDGKELIVAKQAFHQCCEDIVSKLFPKIKKYQIVVQGLGIMNDEPSSVSVLFGNAHMENPIENENLQKMVDRIAKYCHKTELAPRQKKRVKLHVSLMNIKFRGEEESKEKFDASKILEKYENFYLGTVNFDSVHLSIVGSAEEKYYEAASVFEL